jgi:hypothetical protein
MPSEPRQPTPEECWQISCHEAGHAIVAVRLGIIFEYVERGEGEHGVVELIANPIDNPEIDWDKSTLQQFQVFYAGGGAAERLFSDSGREYALKGDRCCHEKLEQQLKQHRSEGFEEDITFAIEILDRCAVEKVAKELDKGGRLAFDDVAAIIGCKVPWE